MAGFGLRHGRSQGMDGYTGNQFSYPIDPANTNLIFNGDAVVLNGGFIEEISGNTPGPIAPGAILGVFQGWRDPGQPATLGGNKIPYQPYWNGQPGAQAPLALVAMPPHSLFYIRGDSSITFTQADIGTRRALIYAPGDARTATSAVTLGAVNAAGPVLIQQLAPLPNNSFDDEPIFEVAMIAQQGTAADVA